MDALRRREFLAGLAALGASAIVPDLVRRADAQEASPVRENALSLLPRYR
jgi:hypothetical protein